MRGAALAAALAATAVPACPVCGVGQPETEWAYIAMTVVLSLLPLAMMGGLIMYLYRRSRAAELPAPVAGRSAPLPQSRSA